MLQHAHELDRVINVHRWDRPWAPVALSFSFFFGLAQTQSQNRALQLNHGTRNGHLPITAVAYVGTQ